MPKEDGSLSVEEVNRISSAINARWMGRPDACPICGNQHWQVGDRLVAPMMLGTNGAMQLGGQIYPMVVMFSPCGYTRFFNAIMLGVFPEDWKKASQSAPTVAPPQG